MRLRTKMALGSGLLALLCCVALGIFLYLLLHRTDGHYFDSDGARIFYTVEGAGPPVVLVHGVGANADLNWRRPGVVRRLAQDFQVITFDLRGHGLSDKPTAPEEYGIEMVHDIARLLDHLEVERAHVAGYSLGGFLALKAVTTHPDRFLSASICAAGWKDPDDPSPIPNPYRPPISDDQKEVSEASMIAVSAAQTPFHRVRNYIGSYLLDEAVKKSLKRNYDELAVPREALGTNTVPLLCLIGTRDGFLFLARDLAETSPHVESHEMPGLNHFNTPFRREFKDRLHDFLKRHP